LAAGLMRRGKESGDAGALHEAILTRMGQMRRAHNPDDTLVAMRQSESLHTDQSWQ
jgi:hypothetical protein